MDDRINRKLIAAAFGAVALIGSLLWLITRPVPSVLPESKNPTHIATRSVAGGSKTQMKFSYTVEQKKILPPKDTSRSTLSIVSAMEELVSQARGTYGVSVFRLEEKIGYGFNEDVVFPAASIMKVPIMVAALKDLDLDQTYILKDSDKQSGSGPIEFMEAGTNLSVRRILQETGQKSDNSGAFILASLVGRSKIRQYLKDWQMHATDFDENTITLLDLNILWQKLYALDILTKQQQNFLFSSLQNSIYEERIPKGIKGTEEVIHKAGSDANIWSDSGIVLLTEPYIISILTTNVDLVEAKKYVPLLSKLVYDYELARVQQKTQNQNTPSHTGKETN